MKKNTLVLAVAGLCTCGFILAGCSRNEGYSTNTGAAVQEESDDLPGAEARTTTAAHEEVDSNRSVTSETRSGEATDGGSKTAAQTSETAAENEESQAAN